jgi:hypothetical protein
MDRDSASIVLAYCGQHPCSDEIANYQRTGVWHRSGCLTYIRDNGAGHQRTGLTYDGAGHLNFFSCGCTTTHGCWLHKFKDHFGPSNEWSIAITALAYRISSQGLSAAHHE